MLGGEGGGQEKELFCHYFGTKQFLLNFQLQSEPPSPPLKESVGSMQWPESLQMTKPTEVTLPTTVCPGPTLTFIHLLLKQGVCSAA